MNVSLRQVEIFLAVARTLSFSQAARDCHLSQPALSANVKRLEESMGARLFDRHTRKVSMTAVGQEFFKVASAMAENMDMALARMQDFVSGKRGRLVIAAAPSMAASFAPQAIAEFARDHPEVDVELHDELSDLSVGLVRSGVADLALSPVVPKAADLRQLELFRDHLVLVCHPSHPLASRATVRWRDVQPYAHVVVNQSSSVRQLVDAQYARYGVRLRPAFEVAHVGTMLGLIAAKLCVGELPESFIRNIDTTGLSYRRIASSAAYRTIGAITSSSRSPSPLIAPFLECCQRLATRFARN
ncbi:HTH-type transcriptional regulator GltC [Variovorax sp. SRS16]|uniref:LysR family transcriptional regulator n=1 Tax=Variovorax sp. SRS16 TaxID=282217 RepID=UPI0013182089|nr:LysR family transcriptional regulator [Variovorax sp. SRS16]VTU30649.1 HTH-type transcriptional regulator GltC [Variovorax sp. SRS16]